MSSVIVALKDAADVIKEQRSFLQEASTDQAAPDTWAQIEGGLSIAIGELDAASLRVPSGVSEPEPTSNQSKVEQFVELLDNAGHAATNACEEYHRWFSVLGTESAIEGDTSHSANVAALVALRLAHKVAQTHRERVQEG